MHIYADINEPTVRRTFHKHVTATRGLTVYDKKLRGFGLKVAPDGTKTFFVRTVRQTGSENVILGKPGKITAADARRRAMAELDTAKTDRVSGPLFRDHAEQFMRRQARRWKPATQESNRHLLNRYILPFFGDLCVADIAPADVRRWFDSMSATPANANRALPVLSVMMTQAELWNVTPTGLQPLPQDPPLSGQAAGAVPVARRTQAARFRAGSCRRHPGCGRGPAAPVHRRAVVGDHRPEMGVDPRHPRRAARFQDRPENDPTATARSGDPAESAA